MNEEIKHASLEYSGDGGSGSASGTAISGSGGFHSGSGDNRMLAASGASSGGQEQVVLPFSTSLEYRPDSTSKPAEALGETKLSQIIDEVYRTVAPPFVPVGLSAPSLAAAPTTVGPPGIARGTTGEQSESVPSLACFQQSKLFRL